MRSRRASSIRTLLKEGAPDLSNIWRIPPKEERTAPHTTGERTSVSEPFATAPVVMAVLLGVALAVLGLALRVG